MSIRTKVLVTIATVATMTAIGTTKAYALENTTVNNTEKSQITVDENLKNMSTNKELREDLKNEAKDKKETIKSGVKEKTLINKKEINDKKIISKEKTEEKEENILHNKSNKNDLIKIKKISKEIIKANNTFIKNEEKTKDTKGQEANLYKNSEINKKSKLDINLEKNKISNRVQGKIVNVESKADIRENPSVDSVIIGQVSLGENIKIDKSHSNSEWYGIYFGEHGGFISTKYIEIEKPSNDVVEVKTQTVSKSFNGPASNNENNIVEGEVIDILSKLNVRESASVDSVIIGQLSSREKIKIDKNHSNSEWYGICFGEHGGFVSVKYIKLSKAMIDKDENKKDEDKDKNTGKDDNIAKDDSKKEDTSNNKEQSNFVLGEVINVSSYLNVREKPTTKSDILGKIYEGNQVLINKSKSKDGWYEIAFGNKGGYVSTDYIKIIKKDYLITDGLVKFVASYEGYSATAYRGADYQNRTIGYGHVIMPGEIYSYLTEPEARNLLKSDLNVTAIQVKKVLDKKDIKLNTHQFDSLVSFAYNCGVQGLTDSRLLRDIQNKADLAEIKDAFLAWRHCNGIELEGLRRRRVEEFEMYSTGDYIRDIN